MNTKTIICPNCNTSLKIGMNCYHAQDLSLVCSKCQKIVYPTTEAQENTINRFISTRGRNYDTKYTDND